MKITFPMTRTRPAQPLLRAGFSLIELMIVIVIIGILLALILPAIFGANRTARIVQVVTDIKDIEKALADFELKYGVVPPSTLTLVEDGSYDTSVPAERATLAFFRQIWPSYNPATAGTSDDYDFNGDGSIDGTARTLSGSECLVFWLLGYDPTANPGFSNNPSNPFAVGGTRIGPFIDVNQARLSDTDSDGFEEYLDPLASTTQPYEFFSSGGGRAYDASHSHGGRMTEVYWTIDNNWPDYSTTKPATTDAGFSPTDSSTGNPPGTPQKAKSYQIISPGFDGDFGHGGLYIDNTVAIWTDTANPDTTRDRDARSAEVDNITNFSSGELGEMKPYVWDR